MVYKISDAWLTGLKGEDKDKMRQFVVGNQKLLDKLVEILYNIEERTDEVVLSDYDSPSWSHKQAHLNGQRDVIRKLITICTIKERDDQPTI